MQGGRAEVREGRGRDRRAWRGAHRRGRIAARDRLHVAFRGRRQAGRRSSARRRARRGLAGSVSVLPRATAARPRRSSARRRGLRPRTACWRKHRWAEVAGVFQGKPAWGRIDDQQGNPGYPGNGWLLRHGFGFLNVSYPGLTPHTLEPGKPLVLKYRVTLGRAKRSTSEIMSGFHALTGIIHGRLMVEHGSPDAMVRYANRPGTV